MRLAGLAAVSLAVVRGVEQGRVGGLTVRTLLKISRALGCTVLDLVPGLSLRHGPAEGEVVEEERGTARSQVKGRREMVRRRLVEWMQGRGGRARKAEVMAEFRYYGLSESYMQARRLELGIRVERRPGVRAEDASEWVLPARAAAAGVGADEV